jgi:radical SAM superfamily enzyme YgiQ (UPF0313 family)
MNFLEAMGGCLSVNNKVVLVNPNTAWCSKKPSMVFSQGMAIITAILKPVCDFFIVDANGKSMSERDFKNVLTEISPLIVMITSSVVEYHMQTHLCAKLAKEALPDSIVVLGGIYPTSCENEALDDPNVDYVFLGHAEERVDAFIVALLDDNIDQIKQMDGIGYKNGGGQINPQKTYLHDVKKLVDPDYSLMDLTPYVEKRVTVDSYITSHDKIAAPIMTSYGCPFDCNFCSVRVLSGGKIVFRALSSVIKEIEYFIETYGVTHLMIYDDNILLDKERFKTLFTTLESRGHHLTWQLCNTSVPYLDDDIIEFSKAHGCSWIMLPVESGNERVLRDIIHKPYSDLNKVLNIVRKCKDVGLTIGGGFIIGLPGETWQEIRNTFAFAEKCDFDIVAFSIAVAFPKTRLYKTAIEQNLLPNGFSFRKADHANYGDAMLETDQFSPMELKILRAFEWDRINFSTPQKRQKIAEMFGVTMEELDSHRRKTRRSFGLYHVKPQSK